MRYLIGITWINNGRYVSAIKELRYLTNWGLKDSKVKLDHLRDTGESLHLVIPDDMLEELQKKRTDTALTRLLEPPQTSDLLVHSVTEYPLTIYYCDGLREAHK